MRGYAGGDGDIHHRVYLYRLLFALGFLHRAFNNFAVKVVAHGCHMPVLLRPQQVARAAYFKVPHCYFEACSELGKFAYGAQAFFGNVAQNLVPHKR